MSFFVILLGYLVRRQLDAKGRWDSQARLEKAILWMAALRTGQTPLWALASLLLWIALLLLALKWFASPLVGLFVDHLLGLVLLVLLMGYPAWRMPLKAYAEAWRRADLQAAWHHVRHLLPDPERGDASVRSDMKGDMSGDMNSAEALHQTLSAAVLTMAFERYFLIIFWFFLLGPAGVLLSRGLLAIRDHWPDARVRQQFASWARLMAWLPALALSATFSLAGDLAGWLSQWRQQTDVASRGLPVLLFDAAKGALSSDALDPRRFKLLHPEEWPDFASLSLLALRDLLNRSMLIWFAALALLTIGGVI